MAFPNARVAVNRHDQLPAWLLESWAAYAEAGGIELEDEEPATDEEIEPAQDAPDA
jgi:hypothetical protein